MDYSTKNQTKGNSSTEENQNKQDTYEPQKIIMIEKVSELLSDICDENKSDNSNNNQLIKPFLSKEIPSISIKDYLIRLNKYAKINKSTIIIILIYIDKVCRFNHFKLTYYIIHKLILASMLISIKYNEDEYYSLSFYAKAGGVSKNEISNLEYQFLVLINFELYINEELFLKYTNYLEEEDEGEEGEEGEEKVESEDA